MAYPPVRFSAIGLNHGHIYDQARILLQAGAEFISFYSPEPELSAPFASVFPMAKQVKSADSNSNSFAAGARLLGLGAVFACGSFHYPPGIS